MGKCSLLETCIFFNDKMSDMPTTAETFKRIYCQSDFRKCARYMIVETKGRGAVPSDLFPNQADRAKEIIAA